MSDFLTNLVMRSFSGAPSVQPMTHSTYAPLEALPEALPETVVEQTVNKPLAKQIPSTPVKTVTEPNQPATSVEPIVVPKIQTEAFVPETFESEQSVFPINLETPATPDNTIDTKTETELQPANRIFQTRIERVTPANTIASPNRVIKHEPVAKPQHELEIVEHVIEHSSVAPSVERQITRPVTRTITRQVERPVTRQVAIEKTIENTIENTIEHTIENTHTIEHTQQQQQLTSSFTTLIPNTPPRPLPPLKSRPLKPAPDLPNDDPEQPTPQPETVINVAIGRIEVRATPASTPKRERQQNGPKIMTLDDYLQKRSRGAE